MHPHHWQKGGAEKKYGLGFQKLSVRGALISGGGLNSKRGRVELNSQRGLDSQGLPCFSASVLFLWQHSY